MAIRLKDKAKFGTGLNTIGTIDGLTLAGGGITGTNYNIAGVNQLTIADPGEGIVFTGTNNVTLAAIDDSADNIMNFAGAAELRVNNVRVLTTGDTLNSDTVDSLHAASFLRSDADSSTDSSLTVNGQFNFNSSTNSNYNEGIRLNRSTTGWGGASFGGVRNSTSGITDAWWVARNPSKNFVISYATSGEAAGLTLPHNSTNLTYKNHRVWNANDFANNSGNWNTAYGWGNHAGAGYSGFNFGTSDLTFQGADPGDIVWKDASGTETHRIWAGSTSHLTYRLNAGTTYAIIHEGNVSNYALPLGGGTLTGSIYAPYGRFRNSQTNNNYTTAALWTESYNTTTTGIAFHISGTVGKFLEMRTNGVLYWQNSEVLTDSIGLRSNVDDSFTGALTSTSRNNGIFGTYDSTKTDHIWSMGTAYKNSSTGANFGNLYGLAYKHTNNTTGGTMGGGHQAVWAANGSPKASLGESGIWTIGYLAIDSYQGRSKLRLWNTDSNYAIGFKSGYTFGHIANEYAMSFQVDSTANRGFWWGKNTHSDAQGGMALTSDGKLNVAKSISIGEGETTTSPSTTPLYVLGQTNGETVLDIQGTNGQLFSITDNLEGSLLAVSDISGIPVLDVKASGEVKVDGNINQTTSTTNTFTGAITSTGNITGANLSGTNTGDQTISSLGALSTSGGTMSGDIIFNNGIRLEYSTTHWITPRDTSGNMHLSTSSGGIYLDAPVIYIREKGTEANKITINNGALTATGNITGANLSGTNTGDQTLPTAASLGAVTLTGNQTISGTKTFDNGSIAISGTHGTISFMDTTSGEDNFYLHANSNNFYVLVDRDATDTIDSGYDSPHPLQLEGDTNTAYTFGNRILTTADEGTGNGLDADTLDGLNSGQNGASVILKTHSNGYLYINNWIHPADGTGLFYDAGVHFYESGNNMYSNTGISSANQGYLWGSSNDGKGGLTEKIFNNQGNNHSTYTDFNNTDLRAGVNYIQQGTNGPTGTTSDQWYSMRLGLGNDYGTQKGGSADYYSEIAWNRQSQGGHGYLYARDQENGTVGSWRKFSAGDADTLDGVDSSQFLRADQADTATSPISFTGGHGGITITGTSILSAASSAWTGNPGANGKIQYHSNRWYIVADSSSNRIVQFRRDSSDKSYIDNNGKFIGTAESADNADTVDGVHASYTRNLASSIPIRDSNGYLNLGWINTTSGNTTSTLTDVYVNTNDGYIRKATPAHFRSQITDGVYLPIGSTAVNATKAQGLDDRGFGTNEFSWFQDSGTHGQWSGGWASHLISNHGAGATYYRQTIHMPFWGPPQYSRLEDGTSRGPYAFCTSESDFTTARVIQASTLRATADVVAYYSSDKRLKENITPIKDAIGKIKQMGGYEFDWNDKQETFEGHDYGVIAQEVEKVLPELVKDREDGFKGVRYEKLASVLIEGIKEQQTIIENQQKQIDELKDLVGNLIKKS